MIKIVNEQSRNSLMEGRDNGMAFAFLQKKDDQTFHTVQPLSPCKDYLAEIVFTEKYGIPTGAWGFSYKEQLNIFTDIAYMVIKILKRRGGGYTYSPSFLNDVKLLNDNYKHIERLINEFETTVGLKILTTIEPTEDDSFLLKFSSEWCQSTHSISLYTLLLRVLIVATEEDKELVPFLQSYDYSQADKSLLMQVMNKILLILETKKLPPNTKRYSKKGLARGQSPHNNGIVSWDSSFDEIQLGE